MQTILDSRHLAKIKRLDEHIDRNITLVASYEIETGSAEKQLAKDS